MRQNKTIQTNYTSANQSRIKLRLTALAVLTAAIFTFQSCDSDDLPPGRIPDDVVALINSVDMLPVAEEFAERIEIIKETTSVEQNNETTTQWMCVTKRISASRNPDEFAMINPLASVLWPGNLIQGASLASGVPTPIPVHNFRQPGRISLAIVTGGSQGAKMYREVDRMTFSAVNQAMSDILSGFPGQGPAQYSFSMDYIRSESELHFVLNSSFSGWGARASAGHMRFSSDSLTRILVRLRQAYFTMVYDDPHGFHDVFTPDITLNDLRNFTGHGNPITYISSVTFGRVFYILYESTVSEDSLRTTLSASFNATGVGVSISADMRRKIHETLARTTAQVFQLGGDGYGGITAAMAVDLDAIRSFLERGINFNAQNVGAPISYTVRYLKNNQIVRVNNTMEFEIEQCTPMITDNVIDLRTVSESGNGFTFANNVLTVQNGANLIITTNNISTARSIAVNGTASITLRNATITGAERVSPISLNRDASLTLTLEGTNRLTASMGRAGIQTSDAILTIRGTGTLIATGGNGENGVIHGAIGNRSGNGGGAGIGGSTEQNGGTITINSGTIIAQGGRAGNGGAATRTPSFMPNFPYSYNIGLGGGGAGAGLGGGGGRLWRELFTNTHHVGNGATVIINGGTVTATGGAAGTGSNGIGSGGLSRGGGGGGGAGANIGGGGGAGGGGGSGRYGGVNNNQRGANGTNSNGGIGGRGGNGGGIGSPSFAGDSGGNGGTAGVLIDNR